MGYSYRGIYSRMKPWPAATVASAIAPVREAFDAHTRAADAADTAQDKYLRARQTFQDAERDDQAAALDATRKGRDVPAPTVEEKREAMQQAHRSHEAFCAIATEAENHLTAVVTEHRQEWLEAITPDVEKTSAAGVAAFDRAQEALTDAAAMAQTFLWLQDGRFERVHTPTGNMTPEVAAALDAARAALRKATPAAIEQANRERREQELARAEEIRQSVGGIVVGDRARRGVRTH